MDAKEFLEKHGLSQLTKLIVEDNKGKFSISVTLGFKHDKWISLILWCSVSNLVSIYPFVRYKLTEAFIHRYIAYIDT